MLKFKQYLITKLILIKKKHFENSQIVFRLYTFLIIKIKINFKKLLKRK